MAFRSRIQTGGAEFAANREAMLSLVARLRDLEKRAEDASERSRERFEKRGQLTPRERLARLLDPGMPFLRLHSLAGYMVDTQKEEKSVPGSSLLCGVGFVAGARCMIWVDDSGIKAGAMGAMSLPVALSVQRMALRLKLPLVHLVESAGANLMKYQVEHWAEGGRIVANLARLLAALRVARYSPSANALRASPCQTSALLESTSTAARQARRALRSRSSLSRWTP